MTSGRFQPGQHWRPARPHWDRAWLVTNYIDLGRSTGDMARDAECTDANILYWMKRHKIPRRDVAGARRLKHWGVSGADNPMFGKTGPKNPNYKDGSSATRQREYATAEGRDFIAAVLRRDRYRCLRCDVAPKGRRQLHVHHKASWAEKPDLRFDPNNGVTLCKTCHNWVHSKANVGREFLA